MRFILIGAALAATPLAAVSEDLPPGAQLAASCAMCHGTEGRSAGGAEPLAGMPKEDLIRKFGDFRSGARPATVMHQIAKGYSDAQVNLIAEYFSARKK
jgi:cytochrome subunit of sulfide dehydrogenase